MNRAGTLKLTPETSTTNYQRIFLFVLLGLLTLRIPFWGGMGFFNIQWEWTTPIYQIGTYLLTTFLIWWEVDHLADYHIDTFVVIVVVLFKPIQTLILSLWGFHDNLLAFPNIPSLLIWSIALVFALGMWSKRSRLPARRPGVKGWVFIGMLVGLLMALALSYPMSLQIPKTQLASGISIRNLPLALLGQVFLDFPYQVGYAAVSEEPLFRGFLWGYLRKLKWRETWIWLFQAGLFMFSHIYYVTRNPISFWILVPFGALVLGWLAWRSRTIAASMAAHGMVNATGYTLGYFVALWRLG
jgi:membrane protease YdiL (CAAX protease family)